jgi:hypothetical protein
MPRRPLWPRALAHRVGRRGYFLILLCVVDAIYGWRMVQPESPGQADQNRYLADVLWIDNREVSLWIWASIWWLAGAVCLFNAFRRQDRWGFGFAFGLKVIWVVGNALAGLNGMPGAYTRCVVWAFIASVVLMIANWSEPRYSLHEALTELEQTGELPALQREEADPREGE